MKKTWKIGKSKYPAIDPSNAGQCLGKYHTYVCMDFNAETANVQTTAREKHPPGLCMTLHFFAVPAPFIFQRKRSSLQRFLQDTCRGFCKWLTWHAFACRGFCSRLSGQLAHIFARNTISRSNAKRGSDEENLEDRETELPGHRSV